MFRSTTSEVSALSGFVATGGQTLPTFPPPSLKFRTAGFPQYGFKPALDRDLRTRRTPVKRSARIPVSASYLYAVAVSMSASERLFRSRFPNPVLRASHSTRWPRGPWLRNGFCCPAASSLTMTSSEPLGPSRELICFVSRGFARQRCLDWDREGPQFTLCVCPSVPSSVPRWTVRVRLTVPSPLVLAFVISVETRHPQRHGNRFTRGQRIEAAKFALCYGPARLLALHRQGRLRPSFHLMSHLLRRRLSLYGIQSIPVAGLSPARHTALWAASKDRKEA
jgi:hypothetical protein